MFIKQKTLDELMTQTVNKTFIACAEIANELSKKSIVEGMTGKQALRYLAKTMVEVQNDNT